MLLHSSSAEIDYKTILKKSKMTLIECYFSVFDIFSQELGLELNLL